MGITAPDFKLHYKAIEQKQHGTDRKTDTYTNEIEWKTHKKVYIATVAKNIP
jgi:hypothetical protein